MSHKVKIIICGLRKAIENLKRKPLSGPPCMIGKEFSKTIVWLVCKQKHTKLNVIYKSTVYCLLIIKETHHKSVIRESDGNIRCSLSLHLKLIPHAVRDDSHNRLTVSGVHTVTRRTETCLRVVAAVVERVFRHNHSEVSHQLLVCRTDVDRVKSDVVGCKWQRMWEKLQQLRW